MDTTVAGIDKSGVYYRKTGRGPAVVLLHGFPEDGNLWEPVWPALSDMFTVIVPDIPGSGRSSGYQRDRPSMESFASDINSILEWEGLQEVVIIGHSMGGYISLAFAADYPSKLKGLGLVHSTAAADTLEKKEQRKKAIEVIRKGGEEPFIKQMVPNLFTEGFRSRRPEVVQEQIERGLKLTGQGMIDFYNAMIIRPDRTSILKKAGFPVQWVIGKEDKLIPPEAVMDQIRLADINFVELYAECAHMSMLEQPDQLRRDLKQFITYCYNQ